MASQPLKYSEPAADPEMVGRGKSQTSGRHADSRGLRQVFNSSETLSPLQKFALTGVAADGMVIAGVQPPVLAVRSMSPASLNRPDVRQ